MKNEYNEIKIHDPAFRYMISLDPQGFLDRFGIPYTFEKFLNTENVQKISSKYQMDCLIKVKEGYVLNIEFQSTYPTPEKQEALKWYAVLGEIETNCEVLTFVITIPPIKNEVHCNKLKSNIYHKTYERSCKNLNGQELLNNIKSKLRNNQKLTPKDIQDLMLAPYSIDDIEKSGRLLKQSIEIALGIKENENRQKIIQKNQIIYFLLILCPRIADKKLCKEIRRLVKMENPVYKQMRQDEREDIATNLKEEGIDINIIARSTGLTKEEINNL